MNTTRHPTAVLALLTAAALPAAAQTLSPAPAPGLWSTEHQMTINGKDMAAAMKSAMAAALKDMPPEHRAMAEQMMAARGMPGAGGPRQDCLTPAEAARRSDARTMLDDVQRDSPSCRYEPVQVSGAKVSFKGRCADPQGFTGDIAGELTMDGAKAWSGRWTGKGRMAGDMSQMPGLGVGPDGKVEFGWTGRGRWVAASCGAVPPR